MQTWQCLLKLCTLYNLIAAATRINQVLLDSFYQSFCPGIHILDRGSFTVLQAKCYLSSVKTLYICVTGASSITHTGWIRFQSCLFLIADGPQVHSHHLRMELMAQFIRRHFCFQLWWCYILRVWEQSASLMEATSCWTQDCSRQEEQH